jgi:hypothetical protein
LSVDEVRALVVHDKKSTDGVLAHPRASYCAGPRPAVYSCTRGAHAARSRPGRRWHSATTSRPI